MVATRPALVLGSRTTALGTIRALGREGIPVYAKLDERDFVCWSRWFREIPSPANSLPEDLGSVLRASSLEAAVLFPCSDIWAQRVARLDPDLASRFPASLASVDVLEKIIDKGLFARAVVKAQVPHPATWVLRPDLSLDEIPDEFLNRAFLKPRQSQLFNRQYGVKGIWINSREQARQQLERCKRLGLEMVIQQYVEGPATNHYIVDGFADAASAIRMLFVRHRLRMYPPYLGNSSYMVSVPEEEVRDAVDSVTKLVHHLRYRGIFSAEFKRDQRDGEFKILEMNGRPWSQVEFAARCGVNVCAAAYREALGSPVPTVTNYRVGRYCVNPNLDYFACRQQQLSVFEWLRSCAFSQQLILCRDDPLPVIPFATSRLSGFLKRRLTLAMRRRSFGS